MDERLKISTIRDKLRAGLEYDRQNRNEAEIDLQFRAGIQWDDSVRRAREAAGRPVITVNKLGSMINQVINDIRQSDLAIKARPADGDTDPELAETYSGIIRQIQEQSGAKYVYSGAADHCITCGIGHFRVITDYIDDAAFDQEILIELIPNPLSVVWDPASIKPDRTDANYCFVTEKMPLEDFRKAYPNARDVSVDSPHNGTGDDYLAWATTDEILIAEYWEKVPVTKTLALMEDGATVDITGLAKDMLATLPIVSTRDVSTHKIQQSVITGEEVLEGPNEWAGKFIPVIPVIGDEIPNKTKVIRQGLVRGARDSQQMYNFWRSAATEAIMAAPKSPWLVTDNMIKHNRADWLQANTSASSVLIYKPDENAPSGPQRQQAPQPPAAMWQEGALSSDDIKSVTGIHDASLGARSNETSGKAIMARQREGDVANYHFTDHLQRALEHCGRVLIDLIPKIYDTQRIIRILGNDDSEEFVPINHEVIGMDGEPVRINDLSTGRFDVKVSIGPSYTTKRLESAESLMEFVRVFPPAAQIAGDLIAKNMDWAGAEEIADRLKKLLPPGMAEPDENTPPPQPDPMQLEMQRLQLEDMAAEIREKEMNAFKDEADARGQQLDNIVKEVQLSMI